MENRNHVPATDLVEFSMKEEYTVSNKQSVNGQTFKNFITTELFEKEFENL